MKTLLQTCLGAVLLCTAFTSCEVARAASSLELNPVVGQATRFELRIHQEISQSIMGRDQDLEQTFQYGYTETVGERGADGALGISVVYDWISVEMNLPSPSEGLTYDSRDPADDSNPLTASFAAIVGKGFRLRVTPAGEILAVEGVTEMLEAMFAELDLGPDEVPLRDAMKKQFGDAAMEEFMQPFLSIYPDGDVSVGDTWRRKLEVTTAFPHVQENTYELLGRSEGTCELGMESRVIAQKGGSPLDMGFIKMRMSMSGTQVGVLTLDDATGMVREARIESDLSGEMEIVRDDMELMDPKTNPAMDPWPVSVKQVLTLRALD